MTKQIIFIGDSLTEWGNWDELFPDLTIINLGIAGIKTAEILKNIEQIKDYNPAMIFLMMGINDLGENKMISEIADNYWETVRKLIKKFENTELYILSILPVDNSRWTNRGLNTSNIKSVNEIIEEITNYYKAQFINLHPYFDDGNGVLNPALTQDGLHLNKHGYMLWKKQIEPYIRKQL